MQKFMVSFYNGTEQLSSFIFAFAEVMVKKGRSPCSALLFSEVDPENLNALFHGVGQSVHGTAQSAVKGGDEQ